jgi:Glycosyl transferase family 2.
MTKPRVHVYTVCWNEQDLLPFFLEHYSAFAERIVVFDNYSTDASPEIVRACDCAELRSFDTDGTFNEEANIQIKNTAYRESLGEADFVVVVDADEFVFHEDILGVLDGYRRAGVTLPQMQGYDMVSWRFPNRTKAITEAVRQGRVNPMYAKRCVFHPSLDINFDLGAHSCMPRGDVVESSPELSLLHYHYVGYLRSIRKHRERRGRLSGFNVEHRAGVQYTWGPVMILARFVATSADSYDVFSHRRSKLQTVVGPPVRLLKELVWTERRRGKWR